MATSSSSSSAKRVAKLAQRGKGKKVRFQGGLLFPAAIVITIVVGMVTVLYARESRPDPGSFPPQVGDHWHAAYAFRICDVELPKITDDKEEQFVDPNTGQQSFVDEEFALTGIHSHGDGVIHYHPYSTRSVGRRAKLGVFLDVYDIELSETRLEFPESEGGQVYDLDEGFRCNGEDTEIKVVAWDSYTDTGPGQTYITDLDDVALRNDGMVFVVAVVPVGAEVPMPSHAANLPELGAADSASVPPSTVEGESTANVPTTVAGEPSATGDVATTDAAPTDSSTDTAGTTADNTVATETSTASSADPGATTATDG